MSVCQVYIPLVQVDAYFTCLYVHVGHMHSQWSRGKAVYRQQETCVEADGRTGWYMMYWLVVFAGCHYSIYCSVCKLACIAQ